VKWRGQDSNL